MYYDSRDKCFPSSGTSPPIKCGHAGLSLIFFKDVQCAKTSGNLWDGGWEAIKVPLVDCDVLLFSKPFSDEERVVADGWEVGESGMKEYLVEVECILVHHEVDHSPEDRGAIDVVEDDLRCPGTRGGEAEGAGPTAGVDK